MSSAPAAARPRRTSSKSVRSRSAPREPVETSLGALRGHCICGNLRMAARLVTAFYDEALKPAGIEANQMMMLWVAHAGGSMPAKALASAAGMDPSTASRNLAVLESRGLVSSSPAPDDRRQRQVVLTRRGRSTLVRAFPRWRRAQAELADLTRDMVDVVALGRELRRVARRMQAA